MSAGETTTKPPNSNGSARMWWRVPVAAGLVAYFTWLTVNMANYVGGKERGERLNTVEAQLMIEKESNHLRVEWDAKISQTIRHLEEELKALNERLRLDELKRNP